MTSSLAASLPPALAAECAQFSLSNGDVMSYYLDTRGEGRPLVLVHSVNAAPSAMEVKPLFEHYRGTRPVYALELPGFGQSPRVPKACSPASYARAIAEFVAARAVDADIVALSLSAEFALRAVVSEGLAVNSLVLISPTGLGARQPPSAESGAKFLSYLDRPWLGTPLWRLLTSRTSIRFFLNQAFTQRAPTELVEYAWRTAHQPSASYVPFRFLAMQLFSAQAFEQLYRAIETPTLILYDKDPNISFERLPELVASHAAIRAERVAPSCGLPHWEQPELTEQALTHFWRDIP